MLTHGLYTFPIRARTIERSRDYRQDRRVDVATHRPPTYLAPVKVPSANVTTYMTLVLGLAMRANARLFRTLSMTHQHAWYTRTN